MHHAPIPALSAVNEVLQKQSDVTILNTRRANAKEDTDPGLYLKADPSDAPESDVEGGDVVLELRIDPECYRLIEDSVNTLTHSE
jgi:hypothetical protein